MQASTGSMNVEILVIGNEVLAGNVLDTTHLGCASN
jgi:molybdopterin-biosynthesis enzyme MoeA-like protein